MSQIHFIGGEKGGVGKSVMARLLAQYFIDNEIPFKAFDADLSHGSMMRYYAAYSEPVDITRFEAADRIVETSLESSTSTIVDMAAQTTKPLMQWIDETGLLDLSTELGLKLTFWHIMDDGSDTLNLLQNLFESYGDKPEYVLVRNYGRGSNFKYFDESETADTAKTFGAKVFDLPSLHLPTMCKIDHISASFWAAANNADSKVGPTLGLLERQRVRTWLNKVYRQLDGVFKNI